MNPVIQAWNSNGSNNPIQHSASLGRKNKVTRWLVLAVFVVFALLYLLTLSPDILPADNGEYQWVAAMGGVAHPPGYPLHTLLGLAMARLPFGTLPWRVNLLSAILAAGTLAIVSAIVYRETRCLTASLVSSLTLGTSTTFWAQATMSNVRTMTAMFTALSIFALMRHGTEVATRKSRANDSFLLLFAASFVLGLTHHLSFAFIGIFLVLYLLVQDSQLLIQPRRWVWPIVFGVLCLAPLIYLPMRAPQLRNPQEFLHYALALGFSGDFFYFITPVELLSRFRVMANVMAFQFHSLVLLVGALGALLLIWKNRRLSLLLVGGFLVHSFVTATYRAPQTVEYMLPAYVLFSLILGFGLAELAGDRSVPHTSGARFFAPFPSLIYIIAVFLLFLASLAQFLDHYSSFRMLARNHDTREYVETILMGAPDGAILLADWHWFKPLSYLQQVEGWRPDMTIEYVAPTAEPYEETWTRRILEELPSRPVIVTHFHEQSFSKVPAQFEPLGDAFLVRSDPRDELPSTYTPTELVFGDSFFVLGYTVEQEQHYLDSPMEITLAWSFEKELPSPITLFVHLVGNDGSLYAQQDVVLVPEYLSPHDVALTRFRLETRPGATPGRYSIQVGSYAPDGPLASQTGGIRSELATVDMAPAETPFFTERPRRERMGNGMTLIGLDWDLTVPYETRLYLHWRAQRETEQMSYNLLENTILVAGGNLPALPSGAYQTTVHTFAGIPGQLILVPQTRARKDVRLPRPQTQDQYLPYGDGIVYLGSATLGSSLALPNVQPRLEFAASRPVLDDYIVSTSLIGLNKENEWDWRVLDDWVPAMGAIPTLKWIAGSRVIDPHSMTVPDGTESARVIGTLILYDAFTGRQLPILDERLAAAAPWVPLGEWLN